MVLFFFPLKEGLFSPQGNRPVKYRGLKGYLVPTLCMIGDSLRDQLCAWYQSVGRDRFNKNTTHLFLDLFEELSYVLFLTTLGNTTSVASRKLRLTRLQVFFKCMTFFF